MITAIFRWVEAIFPGSRKGIEDTAISFVPQAAYLVSGVLISVLLARGLGPAGMGEYALISSIAGLAAILSDLGIGNTAIHYASRAAAHGDTALQFSVLRWAFRLRLILVVLITTAIFFCIPAVADDIWHAPHLSFLFRLSLLIGVFTAISSIPTIYFQSIKHFKMNSLVAVGQTMIMTIGIGVLAILNKWSLEMVIIVSIVAAGLGAVVFQYLVPRAVFFDFKEARRQLQEGVIGFVRAPKFNVGDARQSISGDIHTFAIYMILSSVVLQVALRSDVWLMGYFLDKGQIGLYNVATKYVLPLSMALGAMSTAFWPRAAAVTTSSAAHEIISKTFRLSSVAAAFALLYAITAPLTAPFFFGSDYRGSVLLGQLLCVRYCISMLLFHFGIIGYSLGLVKILFWMNLVQMFIVIFGNILLLPVMGATGAAITLLVYELAGSFVLLMAVRGAVNRLRADEVTTV